MNKAKMTFRFDQEGRGISGKPNGGRNPSNTEHPLSDEGAFDTSRLHAVDSSEQRKSADAIEDYYVAEEWQDPFGTSAASWSAPGYWDKRPGAAPPKRKGPSGWKLFGSVASALMTGGIFGYIVLYLFQAPGNADPPSLPAWSQTTVGNDGQTNGAQSVSLITADIPAQSFYMLQYGVFSTPESAEQAKAELLQAGTAAGTDPSDSYRVYAGISSDREEAKLLGSRLKGSGMDLYVREMRLPALDQAFYNGSGDTLLTYFTTSTELIQRLCHMSASMLSDDQLQTVSESDMTALNTLHQQWMKDIATLTQGLPLEGRTMSAGLDRSMNGAITALAEFNKNSSKEHLWEIQSMMMEYVRLQQQLLEFLKQ
ncbi:SPOR domain-containing protein [Paenibacillus sp. P96]|uniref:SPOR domain-containing protein n=1 Tax=Paenibacillus zeirhizosphaerae TaxID=2987519 RepID=A0ABT9FLS3_9BACL|nr:SPOR domain-containing protein [Paenibacillus sp. P96]MDP4095668.1 SPOR domain-containing protein [Paenibacillus sp. P96]